MKNLSLKTYNGKIFSGIEVSMKLYSDESLNLELSGKIDYIQYLDELNSNKIIKFIKTLRNEYQLNESVYFEVHEWILKKTMEFMDLVE